MKTKNTLGFIWWWRVRGTRARLIVLRPYSIFALVIALNIAVIVGSWTVLGWLLVAVGLTVPYWGCLSIDEQDVYLVGYCFFIPYSRQRFEHPVNIGRDEGLDYESDGILVRSGNDFPGEVSLDGRGLYRLLPDIQQAVSQQPSAKPPPQP